jgi:hypothetical protein
VLHRKGGLCWKMKGVLPSEKNVFHVKKRNKEHPKVLHPVHLSRADGPGGKTLL